MDEKQGTNEDEGTLMTTSGGGDRNVAGREDEQTARAGLSRGCFFGFFVFIKSLFKQRHQFFGSKRFSDKISHTGFVGFGDLLLFATGGGHNKGDIFSFFVGAHPKQQFIAVFVRHVPVADNNINALFLLKTFNSLVAVFSFNHVFETQFS